MAGEAELSILSTAVSVAAQHTHSPETLSQLFSRMIARSQESAILAFLLDAIAASIRSCPNPQLIVLKNCHLISTRAAALLQMLVGRLEADGWGQAWFILESRECERPPDSVGIRLVAEVTNDLGARFQLVLLEGLTMQQLMERVCVHIEAPSPQITAEVLLRQAGGNPLFLEHVMRDLLQSKIVLRDHSGGKIYRIDHFDLFRRRIETLPAGLDDLLRYRVQSIISHAPPQFRSAMAAYLGLTSVISSSAGVQSASFDEHKIATAIGCLPEVLPRVRHRLISEAVMKGSLTHPPAEFDARLDGRSRTGQRGD